MSLKLFNKNNLKFIVLSCCHLFCCRLPILLPNQMAKNVSKFASSGKANQIKIKGKSKFPPGIVKFQVLGSGAYGAPRCLYLFTDHSR